MTNSAVVDSYTNYLGLSSYLESNDLFWTDFFNTIDFKSQYQQENASIQNTRKFNKLNNLSLNIQSLQAKFEEYWKGIK